MITLFTTAKPFRGLMATIQLNALRSWARLLPPCEVILIGDEEGAAEAAKELSFQHIPEVERNEFGTPLVSSIFEIAQKASQHDVLCYVNADIILLSDLFEAVRQVANQKQRFLMVGGRWDVEIREGLHFHQPDWEQNLRGHALQHGHLHESTGLDYFVFSRGVFDNLPPFAVGRTTWDNWLIYRARSLGVPVIDATAAVTAIHQDHDYSHHAGGTAGVLHGAEAKRNLELAGGAFFRLTLEDATHILTPRGLRLNLTPRRLIRRLLTLPVLHPRLRFFLPSVQVLAKISKPARARVAVALRGGRREVRP